MATAKNHRATKTREPFLYFSSMFDLWLTYARGEHLRYLEIPKLREPSEYAKGQICHSWNIHLHMKMKEKVIAHTKRRTPPHTFLAFDFLIAISKMCEQVFAWNFIQNDFSRKQQTIWKSSSPELWQMLKTVALWNIIRFFEFVWVEVWVVVWVEVWVFGC